MKFQKNEEENYAAETEEDECCLECGDYHYRQSSIPGICVQCLEDSVKPE